MKIAIVVDWLVTYAGAERVLEQMLRCFPESDLFSVVDFIPEGKRDWLMNKNVTTSFIQKLPFAKKKYRGYLPLMPLAIEQLDVSGYDVIISSSHCVAKGIITGPDQLHISYVHSPVRYAWDLQHQYLKESGLLGRYNLKGWIARWVLHKMRIWDIRTVPGVDYFIANSNFIGRRIKKVYRRESTTIYPPVAVNEFQLSKEKKDYYLTCSRMVPYKKIDLIASAFTQLTDKQLIIIGEGPDFEKIKKIAKESNNIQLLGQQDFSSLKEYMEQAKAFVFAAEEDFGIVPVEAQACGTPVIAYGKGGVLETVKSSGVDAPTGLFFNEQSVESLISAINEFEGNESGYLSKDCREQSENFSNKRFQNEFKKFIENKWFEFKNYS